ncbi:MAG: hypothetical protein Q7R96_04975 [Nanoarchaeota archaeon]|nr:hypothetical protein [Nanoarchaeota archaeon]
MSPLENLESLMGQCIDLALLSKASGVCPPYVGALVLSPQREVVSVGYRSPVSDFTLHAERIAINAALKKLDKRILPGHILVTTLEPCYREKCKGLTRSCAHLITDVGLYAVVFGVKDTDSMVMKGGQGKQYLESKNLDVIRYGGPLIPQLRALQNRSQNGLQKVV